jgi:hypothetical protein
MTFEDIGIEEVCEGDFLILRYFPMYNDAGIVATKVTSTYDRGFEYMNSPMMIQGDFDPEFLGALRERGFSPSRPLVRLSEIPRYPLANESFHDVGGLIVPKMYEASLSEISRDINYQRSLGSLDDVFRDPTQDEMGLVFG